MASFNQHPHNFSQSTHRDTRVCKFRFKVGSLNLQRIQLLILLLILVVPTVAGAASITLAWGPNESSSDGYRLFLRQAGKAYNYSDPAWQGASTKCTVDQLANGTTYYAVVRAYQGSKESSNSNEVKFTTPAASSSTTTTTSTTDSSTARAASSSTSGSSGGSNADIVIDDGDSGTTATGTWGKSGASGSYGGVSLYSRDASATYTFKAQATGSFEVSVWWTALSSRATKAPVKIYDGSSLLKTVYVNQRIDGGQWNVLGTYQFSSYPKVVIVSTGDGSACADAVEFMSDTPVDNVVVNTSSSAGSTGGSSAGDIVIDDGDSGAAAKGSWSKSGASGAYGSVSMYSRDASSTYTFKAQATGSYKVSVWWTALSSRGTKVPVKIYDGSSLLKTVYVNQRIDGGQWNVLGTYQFSSYPKVVIVSTGDGSVCADAVQYAR